jgi:large subunit ribosomal protein L9
MKVILIEDLRGTGKRGEVIEVKDGFGRNYLLPRGIALPATEGNLNSLDHVVKSVVSKRGRDLKLAHDLKQKLEETTYIVKKKVGLDGKLFGSVTPKDIIEAIKGVTGVELDKKLIKMEETIKMTGAYSITIHLERDVNAEVKVEVEQEQ